LKPKPPKINRYVNKVWGFNSPARQAADFDT